MTSTDSATWNEMQSDDPNCRHKVILADDHTGILERASNLIADEFNVVAAVSDGTKAIEAAVALNPEIVILDICMPGLSGIEAAHEIKRLGLSAKLVLLTFQEDTDYIEAAQALGASYVLKSRMKADLLLALKEALMGKTFISRLSSW